MRRELCPGSAFAEALGGGFSAAYLVCGIAAAVAALLTAVGMFGFRARGGSAEADSLDVVPSARASAPQPRGEVALTGVWPGHPCPRPHPRFSPQ